MDPSQVTPLQLAHLELEEHARVLILNVLPHAAAVALPARCKDQGAEGRGGPGAA